MPDLSSIYKKKRLALVKAKETLEDLIAHTKLAYYTVEIYDRIVVPEDSQQDNPPQAFGHPSRQLDSADFISHDVFLSALLKWRAAYRDAFAAFEAVIDSGSDDLEPFPLTRSQELDQEHSREKKRHQKLKRASRSSGKRRERRRP